MINDWNGHVVDAGSLSSFKNLLNEYWKDCHYYYSECMYVNRIHRLCLFPFYKCPDATTIKFLGCLQCLLSSVSLIVST